MNKRIAFPFLTLPDSAVGFRGWMIGDPGEPLMPAPDILEAWDYERDLEVQARFEIGLDAVEAELGIPMNQFSLAVAFKIGTGAGTLPRKLMRSAVEMVDEDGKAEISTVLYGAELSGRLRLDCSILLESVPETPTSPLAPTELGARLWNTRKDILLEDGGDSRFPIEMLSFSSAFSGQPQQSAPWFVNWKPGQLEADFGGSVRVYINSDEETLAARFAEGDPLSLQAILGDVMSQMVEGVLEDAESGDLLDACPEGSVGQQVRNWLDFAFPGQTISSIRALREVTPGRFRAAILAAARLGEET